MPDGVQYEDVQQLRLRALRDALRLLIRLKADFPFVHFALSDLLLLSCWILDGERPTKGKS